MIQVSSNIYFKVLNSNKQNQQNLKHSIKFSNKAAQMKNKIPAIPNQCSIRTRKNKNIITICLRATRKDVRGPPDTNERSFDLPAEG